MTKHSRHQNNPKKLEEFWKQNLKGFIAPTPLVIERSSGNLPNSREKRKVEIKFSNSEKAQLHFFVKQNKFTLPILIEAAWALLLSRYSGEFDVVYGATHEESYTILPIRIAIQPELSVEKWLQKFRQQREILPNYNGIPLSQIKEWSALPRDVPLFESLVSIDNTVTIEENNCPLIFTARLEPGLSLKVYYETGRFDKDHINRMLSHFKTLLAGMTKTPKQPLFNLPLLTASESQQILVDWNATDVKFLEDKCLHQLFEAQVEQSPDAVALMCEEKQLTYKELNCRANQLAHYLQGLGVGPDVVVGMFMERSLEMVVGLYGILKAGGAYVPLDSSYPKERLTFMVKDTQAPVLLTQQKLVEKLPDHSGTTVVMDTEWEKISSESIKNPESNLTPENLAYVIYTSGSTGRPKGAVLNHRGRVNNFCDFNRRYSVGPADKVLGLASLSFDMHAYDIFGLLAAGGTTVIVERAAVLEPERWAELMAKHKITVWHSVPALLEMLTDQISDRPEMLQSLRVVLLGGDWIPVNLPDRVKAMIDNVQVVSMGGATECSMDSTIYDIEQPSSEWKSIPYGVPMANQLAYVLDRHFNPLPIGVPGELYLGGVGVGREYLNRPQLTADKFMPNPFNDREGDRMYRTGDLARFMPDGNLELLGRIDFQVKVRGYRIELNEITSVLGQHPDVKEAVVVAKRDKLKENRLVAYFVPNKDEPKSREMRNYIQDKLPDYMMPAAFVSLNALPLSPNGKIDRRALPDSDEFSQKKEESYVAPRNNAEVRLAKIWEAILGINGIGVKANFFDLGGNSLQAVKIFAQIRKQFNRNLPAGTLYQASTVETLAQKLADKKSSSSHSLVVPIQTSGSKPPLFAVAGTGGDPITFEKLAPLCDSDQRFYGLRSLGLNGAEAPFLKLEEKAARFVEEIKKIQPEGPFYLIGYSFGAAVVFEMAQQLYEQGEKVSLLGMLNYYLYKFECLTFSRFLELPFIWKLRVIRNKISFAIIRSDIFGKMCEVYRDQNKALPRLLHPFTRIMQINTQAMMDYVPRVYPGRITLFRAEDVDDNQSGLLSLAAGGVDIQYVTGDHATMMRKPHVEVLAEKLNKCLAEAQRQNLEKEARV